MNNSPSKLSNDTPTIAPEGANDRLWSLAEHQLVEARLSLHCAITALEQIAERPENIDEGELAKGCLSTLKLAYREFRIYSTICTSLLTGTDVLERISRKEV